MSLEPGEALALRYRGMDERGSRWDPKPPVEVDVVIPCDRLAPVPDDRLGSALQAWAHVLSDAFAELEQRTAPALAPRDVLDFRLLEKLLASKKLATEADFARQWRWRFSAVLPVSAELEGARLAVEEHLSEHRPIASGARDDLEATLEFVCAEHSRGIVTATVRLVVWQREGESRSIRNVKEQEVALIEPGEGLEPARVKAWLVALQECVSLVLERSDCETFMPHDLLPGLKEFKRPQTIDDFRKAIRRKFKLNPP